MFREAKTLRICRTGYWRGSSTDKEGRRRVKERGIKEKREDRKEKKRRKKEKRIMFFINSKKDLNLYILLPIKWSICFPSFTSESSMQTMTWNWRYNYEEVDT